jgi:hypothetical protein
MRIGEVDAETFVFGSVPTDADGQANPTAAEKIDRGDLLGDDRCLALRQDEHTADEVDAAS